MPEPSHPDRPLPWLGDSCPEAFRPHLDRYLRGELSAEMALMHLLIETKDPERAAAIVSRLAGERRARPLRDEHGTQRLARLAQLADEKKRGGAAVVSILELDLDHDGTAPSPEEGIARWASLFDRAVRRNAEASVALYALGDPDLLRKATAEAVERMRAWGLLGPDRALLEIGCGIGRFQQALARDASCVVGIDISAGMIEAARQRCAGLSNVRLLECSGRDLSLFDDHSFDVVFAVDAFPYLVQSGVALAERHVREAARVLRPHGDLLILNFSYRGDVDTDRADVAGLAAEAGFRVLRNGTREFALWDGVAFHLVKDT